MKNLLLLFSFAFIIYSQNTVTVLTFVQPKSKLRMFELEFINNIIKIYNSKHTDKLVVKIESEQSYSKIFDRIKAAKETDLICAIRSLTITEDRKKIYDFSFPYMPIKQVLITKKENMAKLKNWKNPKYRIFSNPNTIHYKNAEFLSKKYGLTLFKPANSTKKLNLGTYLNKGNIDFYVGDMTDVLTFNDRAILAEFEGALLSKYGVLFPKNSTLKRKLNKFIKYLTKSPLYYKLLVKHFGNNFADFFKSQSTSVNLSK